MAEHIPLPFLRSFEAAARHQSFARAAQELHVTPAAVSQQIRALEDRIGVKLFARGARSLTLTRAGSEYALAVSAALLNIAEATRKLAAPRCAGKLRIGTFPSIAFNWLLPRLPLFRKRFPEIEPELVIDNSLGTFGPDGSDVAIRFGRGEYRGCKSEHLMDDFVFPACSPALLGSRPVPRKLSELAFFPLLFDDGLVLGERRMTWPDWLGADTSVAPQRLRIHLPDGLFTMQAAILGHGVALVRRSLASDHLREGRLIRISKEQRQTDFRYWIVTAMDDDDARVTAFKDWIKGEASASVSIGVQTGPPIGAQKGPPYTMAQC